MEEPIRRAAASPDRAGTKTAGMKVWSHGTVLLVLAAAAAGWMAGQATGPQQPDTHTLAKKHTVPQVADDEPIRVEDHRLLPKPAAPTVFVARAERSGISDVARRSSELIESHRNKPMFGEWSMKYLVVDDALRADVNQDGRLTSEDFAQFVAWMQQGDACADFNVDGLIDARDVETFVSSFTSEELIDVRRDEPRAC